jgi:hypothetical protein
MMLVGSAPAKVSSGSGRVKAEALGERGEE